MQDVKSKKPKLLLEADLASHLSWEKNIHEKLGSTDDQSLFRAILGDPVLRAIVELIENGATSFEGALMLKGLGFVDEDSFQIHHGPLRGRKMHCVTLNNNSHYTLSRWKSRLEDREMCFEDPMELFTKCVKSYLAYDRGSGIVLTKRVAEVALEFFDQNILSRAVCLEYDILQYDLDMEDRSITERDWMNVESKWSHNSAIKRSGAKVIDLWEAW